jgi:hypothetical protein
MYILRLPAWKPHCIVQWICGIWGVHMLPYAWASTSWGNREPCPGSQQCSLHRSLPVLLVSQLSIYTMRSNIPHTITSVIISPMGSKTSHAKFNYLINRKRKGKLTKKLDLLTKVHTNTNTQKLEIFWRSQMHFSIRRE